MPGFDRGLSDFPDTFQVLERLPGGGKCRWVRKIGWFGEAVHQVGQWGGGSGTFRGLSLLSGFGILDVKQAKRSCLLFPIGWVRGGDERTAPGEVPFG